MNGSFIWPDGSLPTLQSHSAAKLRLIKHYLAAYFDIVIPNPAVDRLQISLVDGFCGGGAFSAMGGGTVIGTPLIMLQSVDKAQNTLNQGRLKKLKIDARYYFIDSSVTAINHLKKELHQRNFNHRIDEDIHILEGKFEDHYKAVILDIKRKARVGRSIFLLDQCGYKDVPLQICRDILNSLERSEIILTFATDWLVDYLSDKPSSITAMSRIGITEKQVKEFLKTKGFKGHRYMVQRLMIEPIKSITGSKFFTPFFIRSSDAGRDLWLIHLSKHPTARNVMTSSHWAIGNGSIHQGKAGLNMLGFDPQWEKSLFPDFEFDDNAQAQIVNALQDDIPRRIGELDSCGPITFDAFQRAVVNGTAARIDHIEQGIMDAYGRQDLEVLTRSGRLKQHGAKLNSSDGIRLSRQFILPGINSRE